jgi:hypothetical protein
MSTNPTKADVMPLINNVIGALREAANLTNDTVAHGIIDELEGAILTGDAARREQVMAKLERHASGGRR